VKQPGATAPVAKFSILAGDSQIQPNVACSNAGIRESELKGRKHELNLDPNFNPLDPAQVSDPKCWITGAAAEALKRGMVEKISMIRRAPKYPIMPSGELDMTDQLVLDEVSGKFRLKDDGAL
jgi:hypothetical protein